MQNSRSKSTTCWEKGVCADSDQTEQLFRMARRLRLETMSGMILSRWQPKFAANLVANEKLCLKAFKAIHRPALTGLALIFDSKIFGQSGSENNHQQCYWPAIHDLISRVCPKFKVLSSHFPEFYELLDEQWTKNVRSENISTPTYV